MPALLTGFGVKRDEIIVRRLHEQIVVPHAEAAIPDVRTTFGLPEVMPEFVAVAGVYCPGVVGHCEVERAIYFEHRRFDRATLNVDIALALASDNHRRSALIMPLVVFVASTGSRSDLHHPGKRQVLDV